MCKKHRSKLSRPTRLLAWTNIVVQAALPLAITATPSQAGADSELPPRPAQAGAIAAQVITPGEPRKNTKSPQALPELGSTANTRLSSDEQKDEQARKLAQLASSTGNFLTSDATSDTVASMARSMATSEASDQAQQWLSQFGTARVQLDADETLSLKNSQLDLLLPLYDQGKHLLFTQGSLHRTDDRNQANIGLGIRRFDADWMLGANSFLDYDLSRQHARLGFGVEYWRNYLKFGANSYHRLSSWRDSPDVEDYQERPANGWDVRAEGWLPSMPQLGGKLTFEQYYGDEVALFGKDNRQHNPHAITAGLTYTPIPLLTFNAEQRQGSAGANDTQFGMQLNWRIGEPWRKQTDPDAVAAMRTLVGSRHDLVERNNNIVLEYRKKEVIRLNVAPQITGAGGEQKSLQVSVDSKYGVDRIDWNAAALLQAGGKIEGHGNGDYQMTLPAYRADAPALNVYTVHGVAVDRQGNRSNRSETRVIVNAPVVDAGRSTLTPANSSLPADGKSTQVLTLTLRDTQDGLVDVPVSELSMSAQGHTGEGATLSDLTRKSPGIYEATVTAGTLAQTLTLSSSHQGATLASANVSITSGAPTEGNSTFLAEPATLVANDTATSKLTFQARDEHGNPVTGIAGQLKFAVTNEGASAGEGEVTVYGLSESTPGRYTALLKGKKAAPWTVTPQYNDTLLGRLDRQVTLLAGDLDAGASDFQANPTTIVADNIAASDLTIIAEDIHGNPLIGIADELGFDIQDSDGSPPGTDDIQVDKVTASGVPGHYTAKLRGKKAGTWTVTPLHRKLAIGSHGKRVTLVASALDASQTLFTANPKSIAADNNATAELTIVAKDTHGNPVTNIANELDFSAMNSSADPAGTDEITFTAVTESATPGTYTAKLKGRKADDWTITPRHNRAALTSLSEKVTLVTGGLDERVAEFQANPGSIVANGTEKATLKFTAKDTQSNPISGLTDQLGIELRNSTGTPFPSDKVIVSSLRETAKGLYEAFLSGTLADNYTVTPVYQGAAINDLTKSVKLLADNTPDEGQSTFGAAPTDIAADGMAVSTLTFIAKDKHGNLITGIASMLDIALTDDSGGTPDPKRVSVSALTEMASPGTYEARLSGTLAGSYSVMPRHNGRVMSGLAETVKLLAATTPDEGHSAFTLDPSRIPADGRTTSDLTFTAKDAHDNPVTGIAKELAFDIKNGKGEAAGTDVTLEAVSETSPGIYTAQLHGTKIDTWIVTPAHDKQTFESLKQTVELTALPPVAVNSTFTANPKKVDADGATPITLTFEAKDEHGRPVTGLAGKLKFVVTEDSDGQELIAGDVTIAAITEKSEGTYTATLTGTLPDRYTVVSLFEDNDFGLTEKVELNPTNAFTKVIANGQSFDINAGFPSVAFRGAEFELTLKETNLDDYEDPDSEFTFSAEKTRTGVKITFKREHESKITVSLIRKRGKETLSYTFNPVFVEPSANTEKLENVDASCAKMKMTSPTSGITSGKGVREVGSLWGEWGDLTQYKADFIDAPYWRSGDQSFSPASGATADDSPSTNLRYICQSK
ncbi:inverse autotransporter beta domain-containing protein [Pseudomonas guariconensis]|uniref:inverse autotransporter beta domain-containing protein n=1 Tax=Pseudomonas guariconensis TaxID=1288410 RepID=UPI0018A92858|nr:inverse autotransporter beta domain-containing protein [Pseudomonas guariconensis]MBF8739746.1 inverse autotransporter beta domain-containing protein [Pseudomonas guariconensis]MBF8749110.1 inverse autotransporter beta domain-containing protein [Pseudomonas guariconensis]